ncbi:MAG: alanine racemase [Clostridia bacterium]|nr:alanine racemase [Clostridia bacterium]
MTNFSQRICATVSLENIEKNFRAIRELVGPGCRVLCVVKADAYGHGAVPVARRLSTAGAEAFAVATVDEALELRTAGIKGEILILGRTPAAGLSVALRESMTLSVTSLADGREISDAGVRAGCRVRVHVQVDTGMGRLGFSAAEDGNIPAAAAEILQLAALPGLDVEGIYTHFADADRPEGQEYTAAQAARFDALVDRLKAEGLCPPYIHCANSAATLLCPEQRKTMCRPGICLYGGYPDSAEESEMAKVIPLYPAMQLAASVIHVHDLPAGGYVSYGRTYRADKPRRMAVVAAGYADGVHRALGAGGSVLIRGMRAPIAGRVCMDMFMADVTDIPGVLPGDEAVIFGQQEGMRLSVEEQAAKAGTISYELLCAVSKRVPREYI